jgi:hypothetical protein
MKFCRLASERSQSQVAYLDLVPVLVIQLQSAQTVLLRDNEAVTGDELLRESTREICLGTEGNNRSEGIAVILPAEGTIV